MSDFASKLSFFLYRQVFALPSGKACRFTQFLELDSFVAVQKLIQLIGRKFLGVRIDSFGELPWEKVMWKFIEIETNILCNFIMIL